MDSIPTHSPTITSLSAGCCGCKEAEEARKPPSWSLPKFLISANAGVTTCVDVLFREEGTTALASENLSHVREKMRKVQALTPLALGNSKNATSCQDPAAAEPALLISIRAAITTFPFLGCCINAPPPKE